MLIKKSYFNQLLFYINYVFIFYSIINLQKVNIKKYLKFIHHDRRQTEIITFDQNKILCKDYSCIFNIYVLYYK